MALNASANRGEDAVAAAEEIAEHLLFPAAIKTDLARAVPVELLDALAGAGLYGLFATREVGGLELDREAGEAVIETLAGGCLTTTFVWIQHLSTAGLISRLEGPLHDEWARPLASGARRSGIAFSHLRHPGSPSLTATPVGGGYRVDGLAPLVTGWGLIDVVHVAARLGSDIVWLLVDAVASATLDASRLELAAVNASATVALRFSGHQVPDSRVTEVQPLEEWLAKDAAGLRTNGFLSLGVARRCLTMLGENGRDIELEPVRAALVSASEGELPDARARASLLALEVAAMLIAAGGGRSMVREASAQRLGREALFLLVQGQTAAIRAAQLSRLVERDQPAVTREED
ncbi:MAG: acyl-CoA dehydrogenase family protein [Acidimicrobiales bacterium]